MSTYQSPNFPLARSPWLPRPIYPPTSSMYAIAGPSRSFVAEGQRPLSLPVGTYSGARAEEIRDQQEEKYGAPGTVEWEEEDLDLIGRETEVEEGRPAWKIIDQQTMTYFIAGGLAGAASRTVVSPLERLKIILQVQPKLKPGSAADSKAYTGVWSSLVRMYREEGLLGYMKGNGVNCARIIPYSAVQFASYESLKTAMRKYSGQEQLSTPLRLTAGALAGISSVVSTYPLDLVRSRLSIATASMPSSRGKLVKDVVSKELGVVGMTKLVYRTEGGVRGLYRGMVATAAGVAPYVSLNFFCYESLKTAFIPEDPDRHTDIGFRTLLCGAVAGTVSQTLTYPCDVIRRKMQVAGLSALSPQYSGAIDATIKIVRSEGWWGGMYRGIWPNLLKVAPSIATSFFVYESVKEAIGTYNEKHP